MPRIDVRMACEKLKSLTQPSSVGAPKNEPGNERTVGLPRGSCALTRWVTLKGKRGHHLILWEIRKPSRVDGTSPVQGILTNARLVHNTADRQAVKGAKLPKV